MNITLRQYFAGQVLAGAIASATREDTRLLLSEEKRRDLAKGFIMLAESMIEAERMFDQERAKEREFVKSRDPGDITNDYVYHCNDCEWEHRGLHPFAASGKMYRPSCPKCKSEDIARIHKPLSTVDHVAEPEPLIVSTDRGTVVSFLLDYDSAKIIDDCYSGFPKEVFDAARAFLKRYRKRRGGS